MKEYEKLAEKDCETLFKMNEKTRNLPTPEECYVAGFLKAKEMITDYKLECGAYCTSHRGGGKKVGMVDLEYVRGLGEKEV